jgi:TolB-like protein
MSDVFVSYASSTDAAARRVAEALRALGYAVWRDEDLPAHRPFAAVIEERLKAAKAVVVVWSSAAVQSQWVRAEADFAFNEAKLVQLAVDGTLPPLPFNQIHCADLSRWSGDISDRHWRTVAESVAALVGAPARPVAKLPARPRLWAALVASRWLWAAALLTLAVTSGVGAWMLALRTAQPAAAGAERVAILPFDTLSSGEDARYFADGLQDEMLSVLSNNQIPVVSRTETAALRGSDASAAVARLGAGVILDGTVEEANGVIRVRVHLDDAAKRTVIWSKDFEGAASARDALQVQVGARSTVAAAAALAARVAGVTDPATVGDYAAAKDAYGYEGDAQGAETIARRVVERAPGFASGHGLLAMILSVLARNANSDRVTALRSEAAAEARRALALDAHEGMAYVALSLMRPNRDWRGREALLSQGMAVDKTLCWLPVLESRLLGQSGRLGAAAERARQAVALEPLHAWVTQTLLNVLFETRQTSEGQALLDAMRKKWPGNPGVSGAGFWDIATDGDPKVALTMLDEPGATSPASKPVWRQYLAALASDRPGERPRAAAAIEQAVRVGAFDPGAATVALSRLGDIEGAFAAASKYVDAFDSYHTADPPYLFVPQTDRLRRDPRFMALTGRIGLVDYWRSTGKWPDFCAEPDLPYDCKAVAAQIAGAKPSKGVVRAN